MLPGKTDNDIGCVVRGDPDNFRENMLQCSVLEQLTTTFTLGDNEQLISNIIQISATDQDATLQVSASAELVLFDKDYLCTADN